MSGLWLPGVKKSVRRSQRNRWEKWDLSQSGVKTLPARLEISSWKWKLIFFILAIMTEHSSGNSFICLDGNERLFETANFSVKDRSVRSEAKSSLNPGRGVFKLIVPRKQTNTVNCLFEPQGSVYIHSGFQHSCPPSQWALTGSLGIILHFICIFLSNKVNCCYKQGFFCPQLC